MNYFTSSLITLGIVISFFSILIYADSNGIWYTAEDVRGGTFGEDEQAANISYTFINPVSLLYGITVEGNITFNNKTYNKFATVLDGQVCPQYQAVQGFDDDGNIICKKVQCQLCAAGTGTYNPSSGKCEKTTTQITTPSFNANPAALTTTQVMQSILSVDHQHCWSWSNCGGGHAGYHRIAGSSNKIIYNGVEYTAVVAQTGYQGAVTSFAGSIVYHDSWSLRITNGVNTYTYGRWTGGHREVSTSTRFGITPNPWRVHTNLISYYFYPSQTTTVQTDSVCGLVD